MADVKKINGYDIKDEVARNQGVYSTNEVAIGKFDGKTLYRKCYIGSVHQITENELITFSNPYAANIKKVYGVLNYNINSTTLIESCPIPVAFATTHEMENWNICLSNIGTSKFTINYGAGWKGAGVNTYYGKIIIVFEYTKS